MQVRLKQSISILLLMLLIGCGFHPRGAFQWPAQYQKLYVLQGIDFKGGGQENFARHLVQRLSPSITPTSQISDADIIVQVLFEAYESRELGSNAAGQQREYTYYYNVTLQVLGRENRIIMPVQTFTRTRDYSHNESDLLGKAEEEQNLKREMIEDVLDMFIRRLSVLFNEENKKID